MVQITKITKRPRLPLLYKIYILFFKSLLNYTRANMFSSFFQQFSRGNANILSNRKPCYSIKLLDPVVSPSIYCTGRFRDGSSSSVCYLLIRAYKFSIQCEQPPARHHMLVFFLCSQDLRTLHASQCIIQLRKVTYILNM